MSIPIHLAGLDLPDFRPHLGEVAAGLDLTWAYDWPAGLRLSHELDRVVDVRDRRVLDLGCGRGRLGLTALVLGAAHVGFADGAMEPLAHVVQVLERNRLAGRGSCHRHRWGDPLPAGPWELILGGDILYRPGEFPALVATLAMSLGEGEALLADPRRELEPELFGLFTAHGLAWISERRAADYTLLRITRAR